MKLTQKIMDQIEFTTDQLLLVKELDELMANGTQDDINEHCMECGYWRLELPNMLQQIGKMVVAEYMQENGLTEAQS